MITLLQVVSLVFVATLILANLSNSFGASDKASENIPQHPYLSHYREIETRQQLHSKFPNFNDQVTPLNWGRLNFLHTTDTHGWYAGHINQRQYSSDWGDYISFASHLHQKADLLGVDLLLVDTGDKHDGNGLSDLTVPNGVFSNKIFMYQDYDLVTVGNHELYVENISAFEFETVISHFGERFVSTNVEFLLEDEFVPFGNRSRTFITKNQGLKVFSLAFLFDFRYGANSKVKVTPIADIVTQSWFLELLQLNKEQSPDVVVVFGHIPVSHDWKELELLHSTLRSFFPSTVIQYFGGHSHIRDFAIYDERSTGLQSGRYCETVGFLSLGSLKSYEVEHDNSIQHYFGANDWIENHVSRSYIDFNLHSFMFHSNISSIEDFNTDYGLNVSNEICKYGVELGISKSYGYVKKNYYLEGAPYPSDNSLLSLLERDILTRLRPKVHGDSSRLVTNNSRIILINTGSIRYDLYKGEFTENSKYVVSPFQNKWKVIPGVPKPVAFQIMPILNNRTYILQESAERAASSASVSEPDFTQLQSPYQFSLYSKSMSDSSTEGTLTRGALAKQKPFLPDDEQQKVGHWLDYFTWKSMSYGYVTRDDLGTGGDDTLHKPLPYHPVPNVIQSYEKTYNSTVGYLLDVIMGDSHDELVDVVYYDFIEPYILFALKQIEGDTESYAGYLEKITMYNDHSDEYNVGELLAGYVREQHGY
ncbi:unnamed protein product [Kuraishia capsulata CBS 1993]|uniref:Putative 5'-nucleotidase C-terminal domain-containing protein n=1 Tax=Kuraishia capsulata CBS 1993 TaxID=1382522 RepID=W6MTW5_9ASCO|nr:uncharacterized protein KUCA_T00005947001 [Kuraishia capsulata CBS 1993]CDK29953.1 unnamed protein product [Kuraishia capsulata CBS 1993]